MLLIFFLFNNALECLSSPTHCTRGKIHSETFSLMTFLRFRKYPCDAHDIEIHLTVYYGYLL